MYVNPDVVDPAIKLWCIFNVVVFLVELLDLGYVLFCLTKSVVGLSYKFWSVRLLSLLNADAPFVEPRCTCY